MFRDRAVPEPYLLVLVTHPNPHFISTLTAFYITGEVTMYSQMKW